MVVVFVFDYLFLVDQRAERTRSYSVLGMSLGSALCFSKDW